MTRRWFRIATALVVGTGLLVLAASVILTSVPAHASALSASPLDVVINEIAWMGTTTSSYDEWIELHNSTGSPIDLTGWTLSATDGDPTIPLSGTIPAGGYFLLERSDDNPVPGVTADLTYTGALEDDGEHLVLQDDSLTTIDEIDCGAEWFAGHKDGRVPMERVDIVESGTQPGNWRHNPRCGSATNSAGISRTCTLTVTHVGQDLDYALYFNGRFTATTTTTDHTPMEDALLALIDGASSSIDIALYGLNRQSVVDALTAAHGRGVTVRVVGDDDAAEGGYSASYQALIAAGITVVTDTSSYIQHNKLSIVDGHIVWTGSTNFTDTGLTLNANNAIVITDTTLAAVYTTEFEEMWAGAFHTGKSDNTPHLFDYNGTAIESYFSPTDLVAFEVRDVLASADETIHFAMFYWTDDLLADQVVERLGAGVEVYGVWDALGAANSASDDETLCDAGAVIKTENYAGKVHHKFAVVDVEGSDPTVILGSYNWTAAGAYDNDENTLIIHDVELAQAYYDEWLRLWSPLGLDTMCNPPTIYLPLVARNWSPPIPDSVLNPISNPDGNGYYPVSWPVTPLAETYELEEDTSPSFSSPTVVYNGTGTSWSVPSPGKTAGTYYYRVRGRNPWRVGGYSSIRSVSVSVPGTPTLYPINNSDGNGNYNVTWSTAVRATNYVLQEATNPSFSGASTVYNGTGLSWSVVGNGYGTYYYRVKAVGPTGQSGWSTTQSATVTPPPANVQITYIEYNPPGDDVQGEYVRIENTGGTAANMTNWTLRDIANHIYYFPSFTLNPGAAVRVWTKSGTDTSTDLYMGRGAAVWNNTGDCAYLRDSGGTPIDTYCY